MDTQDQAVPDGTIKLQFGDSDTSFTIITSLSSIEFVVKVFIWLLLPTESTPLFQIGLDRSCPDPLKHADALVIHTTTLTVRNERPVALCIQRKNDNNLFISKAYERYMFNKHTQRVSDPSFYINEEGTLMGSYERWFYKQRVPAPIYNALQNCNISNLDGPGSLSLFWTICREHGKFILPWTHAEERYGSFREAVEFAFFGSDGGNWNPPRCCQQYPSIYASIVAKSTTQLEKLARWITTERNPSPLGNCHFCKAEIWAGAACGDIGFCITCEQRTCLKCGVKWHDFKRVECRLGGVGSFVSIIEANKWAQCYRCGLVVGRDGGCAHITCRCGASFCYHCGGKWPRCPCRTTGRQGRINVGRDQPQEDGGARYTPVMRAMHERDAARNENWYKEVVDALKLLRMVKKYQENVAREIRDLRKRLVVLRVEEEEQMVQSVATRLDAYLMAAEKGNRKELARDKV